MITKHNKDKDSKDKSRVTQFEHMLQMILISNLNKNYVTLTFRVCLEHVLRIQFVFDL